MYIEYWRRILGKKIYVCYLASQICIILSFIAIWRLAKLFLPLFQALLAVMMLEGVYYYNFTSVEYNTNVLMLAIWSWSILYAWKACTNNHYRHWIKLGILLGLGVIDKYYAAILCLAIFLMILYEGNFRKNLKTFKPYLAAIFFIITIAPHLIWLVKNDYPTFSYIATRASSDNQFYHHLFYPLSFLLTQALSILAALIMFFGAFWRELRKPNIYGDPKAIFLIFMIFLPVILTIIPSLLTGSKIKDMWGTSLWGLTGICLFYFFKPTLNQQLINRFLKIFAFISILAILVYALSILLAKADKRDSFNGKLAASEVNKEWLKYSNVPLKIVAGDVWLTSNISFFSNQNISVFIDMNEKISPWVSYQELEKNGGLILWDIKKDGLELPSKYKDRLKSNIVIDSSLKIESSSKRYKDQPNFELGVGIIMPSIKNYNNKND